MYEKEIEQMHHIRACFAYRDDDLCRSIIEALIAAQPRDAAAEREYIRRIVLDDRTRELLMRERAAARAEGYAQAMAIHEQTLLEAQDEHARLRADLERERAAAQPAQQAQAELAALRSAARAALEPDEWADADLPEALIPGLDALQAALDGTPLPAPESAETKLAAPRAAAREVVDGYGYEGGAEDSIARLQAELAALRSAARAYLVAIEDPYANPARAVRELQAALDGAPLPAPEPAEAKLTALRAAVREVVDGYGYEGGAEDSIARLEAELDKP